MNNTVIQIRNLSKRYRLGGMQALDRTFREMIYNRTSRLFNPKSATEGPQSKIRTCSPLTAYEVAA